MREPNGDVGALLVDLESLGRDWFRQYNPTTCHISNPQDAFAEILDRVFYQGRRDEISARVRKAAYEALEEVGWHRGQEMGFISVVPHELLRQSLEKRIGPGKIGRRRDIQLAIGLIQWIVGLPDSDFLSHFRRSVKQGQLPALYFELQSIHGIGPKIAAFVLRDLSLGLGLSADIRDTSVIKFMCPVDLHVRRTAAAIGIPTDSDSVIIDGILTLCVLHGRDCLLVNQGMFGADKARQLDQMLTARDIQPLQELPQVSSPIVSDSSRARKIVVRSRELSVRVGFRDTFWRAFNRYLDSENIDLTRRNPGECHWYGLSGGRSRIADFGLTVRLRLQDVTCELNLIHPTAKDNFRYLLSRRSRIESHVGEPMEWHEYPGRKESRIRVTCNLDPNSEGNWPTIFPWYVSTAKKFRKAMEPYLLELK